MQRPKTEAFAAAAAVQGRRAAFFFKTRSKFHLAAPVLSAIRFTSLSQKKIVLKSLAFLRKRFPIKN